MNIVHTECSMNWGGQEYRTLLEHDYLNKNGHKSWVMCHPNSAMYQKAQELGFSNIIPMDFSKSWKINVAIQIFQFCKTNKIDIINSHNSRDSILSSLAFFTGTPLVRSRQITSPIKKKLSYQYLCSHIIATASLIKNILIDLGVNKNRITVIGEGVSLEEYNPNIDSNKIKKEFNIKNDEIIISNIGIIRGDKGQEYYLNSAIEILKKYDNVRFFLIGKGNGKQTLEKSLQKKVKELQLEEKFIMTGYRNDVEKFIHQSDIIVIASTGVEAQSRIAPQSFATKRAVISTNTGGLTELVKDEETGLVIPAKNTKAMTKAIEKLIGNKELRDKLAENGYKFALEKLSFEKMMFDTLELYKNIIYSK